MPLVRPRHPVRELPADPSKPGKGANPCKSTGRGMTALTRAVTPARVRPFHGPGPLHVGA